jgi:Leucine-rich repeat (LRR) protein
VKALPAEIWKNEEVQRKSTKFLGENNSLKKLPKTISDLENLVFIDLRNNILGALPATICKIKSLHTLLVSGNQLKSLPATPILSLVVSSAYCFLQGI